MKQHLRKLSALLLTLVLAISLAPAALAAPANTDITFDGVMAGDTVTDYPMTPRTVALLTTPRLKPSLRLNGPAPVRLWTHGSPLWHPMC